MEDTATDVGALTPEPGQLAELPRSLAEVVTAHDGDLVQHRLRLSPGATAAEITAAMILMPPAAALVGDHGDAGVSLVFREPARASSDAAVWPAGTGAGRAEDD